MGRALHVAGEAWVGSLRVGRVVEVDVNMYVICMHAGRQVRVAWRWREGRSGRHRSMHAQADGGAAGRCRRRRRFNASTRGEAQGTLPWSGNLGGLPPYRGQLGGRAAADWFAAYVLAAWVVCRVEALLREST